MTTENIISLIGGFILGVLGNHIYDRIKVRFLLKKSEYLPQILKDTHSWVISNGETYFYEKDPDYKIKIGAGEDKLSMKYKKFPDKDQDRISWVSMTCNGAPLFGYNFMYLDGYKILVPVPRTECDAEGKDYDFYNLSNTEIKIFEIIGRTNLVGETSKIQGLKNIASILNISIVVL